MSIFQAGGADRTVRDAGSLPTHSAPPPAVAAAVANRGPLSWVHAEIVVALQEVLAVLDLPDWPDTGTRIGTLAHLHQVSGALRMVELPGPQRLAEEVEAALRETSTSLPDEHARTVLRMAIATLRADLDRRLAGHSVRDLDSLPALSALGTLRQCIYSEVELFFPDLATLPPGAGDELRQSALASQLRADFQRSLLLFLRDPSARAALASMGATLEQLAQLVPGRFGAARWQLLSRVLHALSADEPVSDEHETRAFCARIDRQLRVNAHKDDNANDRLIRETLLRAAALAQPDEGLRAILEVTQTAARLAPLPADSSEPADAQQPSEELQALAQALQQAESQLESWYRERRANAVPSAVLRALVDAAAHLETLGEDGAARILQAAAQQIAAFPDAHSLDESRLEPVAERLAGLRQVVDSLLARDGQSANLLETLQKRLLMLPEPSIDALRPDVSPPDLVARKIDEDVFGVFIEEADGLLQRLYDRAQDLASGPIEASAGALVDLRAVLHTLRGSGLMAGLLPLAQLAGELDLTLASWTPHGDEGWSRPLTLLDDAALAMQRWLARLAGDRHVSLPILPLIERARDLRMQSQSSAAPAVTLQEIFLQETGDRIADLRAALGAADSANVQFAAALRATHTLGGIALTAGHPILSQLARCMESLLETLQACGAANALAAGDAVLQLHAALRALNGQHGALLAGQALQPDDTVLAAMQHAIHALREAPPVMHLATPLSAAQVAAPSPISVPVADTPASVSGAQAVVSVPAAAPARPASHEDNGPANAIDAELLPVFLEECAELLPRLDEALRAWSEGAATQHGQQALQRGLHTLKGSARMAGAFRQGLMAHQLEDLVHASAEALQTGATPARSVCDRIQARLDGLALEIAALDAGEASETRPSAHEVIHAAPPSEQTVDQDDDVAEPALSREVRERRPETAMDAAPAWTDHATPEFLAPATAAVHHAPIGVEIPAGDGVNVAGHDAPTSEDAPVPPPADDIPSPAPSSVPNAADAAPAGQLPDAGPVDNSSTILRLKIETLDRMANAAGETGIARARIETETGQIKRGLNDLSENIQRLKAQLREIEIQAERALPSSLPFRLASLDLGETAMPRSDATAPGDAAQSEFDPLELDRYSRLQELTRTLAEGIDDVQTVHQGLRRGVDEVELALRQQGRVVRDLQQDLLRARMVPFASLAERLQRTVRQAARESGVELVLHIEGAQHEVDRTILERLVAPLEHLLRNAAAHAIEPAAERSAAGKSPQGQLKICLRPGDHEVELRLSDDGRGIDLARVRAKAEAHDMLEPNHASSDQELLQLIFRPGFSTAASITTLAGRGVGLDVVRSEVLGLGGRVHVDTLDQRGTEFTLVIPVTLATVQAVVVRAGDAWFAIPAPLVEQVRPVGRDALAGLHREGVAVWQGLRYPFTSLSSVLGLPANELDAIGNLQLVFLRSADRRCALRVDELAGTQEIVIKTVSPHLARVPGVTGASVLGNGRIVLILNPVPLTVGTDGRIPAALQAREILPAGQTIMVVDDSITVRRVSSRLLERAGYQVQLAKDGQDALERLASESLPAAMLLDVEMPRMDGFELISRLRARPETRDLPIIIITSRTADRHRQHAQELGVQGYLGKPYREEDLLAQLAAIVRGERTSGTTLQLADQSTSPV